MLEITTHPDWDFPAYEVHARGLVFFIMLRADGTWHLCLQDHLDVRFPENIVTVSQAVGLIEQYLANTAEGAE